MAMKLGSCFGNIVAEPWVTNKLFHSLEPARLSQSISRVWIFAKSYDKTCRRIMFLSIFMKHITHWTHNEVIIKLKQMYRCSNYIAAAHNGPGQMTSVLQKTSYWNTLLQCKYSIDVPPISPIANKSALAWGCRRTTPRHNIHSAD